VFEVFEVFLRAAGERRRTPAVTVLGY